MLGGHVRAVFTLVTIIFIGCVTVTLKSFREIPLSRLEAMSQQTVLSNECEDGKASATEETILNDKCQPSDPINRTASYGAMTNERNGDEQKNVEKIILISMLTVEKRCDLYFLL